MAEIIKFINHSKTEPGRCKDASDFTENLDKISTENAYEIIRETIQTTFTDIDWKKEREIEEENAANFRKKYKAVYAFMPNDTKARISYLANIMLNLVQGIFYHPNEDTRLQAFFDYGDFLYKEMEPAMLELENECRKYRKTIPFFKFEMVAENELENAVRKCLENIIFLAGEGKEEEEELLAELYRLFNLDIFLNRKMTD